MEVRQEAEPYRHIVRSDLAYSALPKHCVHVYSDTKSGVRLVPQPKSEWAETRQSRESAWLLLIIHCPAKLSMMLVNSCTSSRSSAMIRLICSVFTS